MRDKLPLGLDFNYLMIDIPAFRLGRAQNGMSSSIGYDSAGGGTGLLA
jgi:hypothetical protein